jgi:hypothetical protein
MNCGEWTSLGVLVVFFGVIGLIISALICIFLIRTAVDGSNTSRKLDILIQEVRLLRGEIKESKHIIDKKV